MRGTVASAAATRGPDFLGIGAQKCATTFVYEALRRHPRIEFPATPERFAPPPAELDGQPVANTPKEMRFLHGRNANLSWEQYLRVFDGKVPDKRYGEITPAYLLAPRARIGQLRRRVPQVRLFVILRDPVERDWSSIRMVAARRGELGDEAALARIANSATIRDRGDYCRHLAAWLDVFPREQLLVLAYERLAIDPGAFLRAICDHLGLPADPAIEEQEEVVFAGPRAPLPDELRADLVRRHRGVPQRLLQLTGIDFSAYWPSAPRDA
jgi:sulfotransferase family protein